MNIDFELGRKFIKYHWSFLINGDEVAFGTNFTSGGAWRDMNQASQIILNSLKIMNLENIQIGG